MAIKFNKQVSEAVLHSPLKDFELDRQTIENRADPLTGWNGIIRTGRHFWQHQYDTDEKLLLEVAEQTRSRCFFCPEKVNESTPRYPEEFIPGGRIIVGEATLFPNLFAQKEHSAIAVMSRNHYVPLEAFTVELLANAFKASAIYLKRLHEYHPGVWHFEMGFNYLFPAGASMPHPHLQVLGGVRSPLWTSGLLDASERYYKENSACYWKDLVDTEKLIGERYIGRLGDVEWMVPFAAFREDEIHGIVRDKANFLEFGDGDWESLADGISRVFKYYRAQGLSSCNFALHSAPLGEKMDSFWAGIRIVSRSSVQMLSLNDVWFSQNLLYDGLVTKPPEEVAQEIRSYF